MSDEETPTEEHHNPPTQQPQAPAAAPGRIRRSFGGLRGRRVSLPVTIGAAVLAAVLGAGAAGFAVAAADGRPGRGDQRAERFGDQRPDRFGGRGDNRFGGRDGQQGPGRRGPANPAPSATA